LVDGGHGKKTGDILKKTAVNFEPESIASVGGGRGGQKSVYESKGQ